VTPRPRALGPPHDPRLHELRTLAVEAGQRIKRAERSWCVNVTVLLFQISSDLQSLLL
jgi:hypothetical protein